MKKAATLVLALALLGACGESGGGKSHSMEYRVTGTARSINVTFRNAGGDISQESERAVPWGYRFTVKEGQAVYVSAQNQESFGTVTCEIWLDGVQVKSSTSSGAYTICTAGGSV
jgi:hypothetical protein